MPFLCERQTIPKRLAKLVGRLCQFCSGARQPGVNEERDR
jgi:hypothetical protein